MTSSTIYLYISVCISIKDYLQITSDNNLHSISKSNNIYQQAGAELYQAQVKLEAIIEVIVGVGVEVVNLSSTTILVGGWVVGLINEINTKLNSIEVVVEV